MGITRFSKKDFALLAVAALIGGPATAQTLLSLANRYLKKRFGGRRHHDFELAYFRNMLSRLRRDGLVEHSGYCLWNITKRGSAEADLLKKHDAYTQFKASNRKKRPDTIITFDIPELQRKKRDYLRLEFSAMGYEQIQKSVWMGHSPIPREFLDYVRALRIARCLQIFTVKDYGTLS